MNSEYSKRLLLLLSDVARLLLSVALSVGLIYGGIHEVRAKIDLRERRTCYIATAQGRLVFSQVVTRDRTGAETDQFLDTKAAGIRHVFPGIEWTDERETGTGWVFADEVIEVQSLSVEIGLIVLILGPLTLLLAWRPVQRLYRRSRATRGFEVSTPGGTKGVT